MGEEILKDLLDFIVTRGAFVIALIESFGNLAREDAREFLIHRLAKLLERPRKVFLWIVFAHPFVEHDLPNARGQIPNATHQRLGDLLGHSFGSDVIKEPLFEIIIRFFA